MKINYLCSTLAITLISVVLMMGCSSDKSADQTAGSSENKPENQSTQETAEDDAVKSNEAATPPPESSWSVVKETKISHETNIEGFLNEEYGITVGYGGEIHYSSDGGQTWPESENSSMCRFCLDIVNENLAWCGGNGYNVRVSSDGGKTWSAVSDISLNGAHSNIDFVDDTTGWITSLTKCVVTKDAGVTWADLTLPEDLKGIAAICLRTPDDGYMLSHDGLFFTTSDGGATWSKQDLGIENYEIVDTKNNPGIMKNNVALADISFSDKDNGVIVFTGVKTGEGYKTWCLTTDDGGATWASELITPVEGFSPTKVFISGDGKYLTLGTYNKQVIVMKRKA